MEISNFDLEEVQKQHHHFLLPGSIRCVIVDPSGCGKNKHFTEPNIKERLS
jgi:hypothetical protein